MLRIQFVNGEDEGTAEYGPFLGVTITGKSMMVDGGEILAWVQQDGSWQVQGRPERWAVASLISERS